MSIVVGPYNIYPEGELRDRIFLCLTAGNEENMNVGKEASAKEAKETTNGVNNSASSVRPGLPLVKMTAGVKSGSDDGGVIYLSRVPPGLELTALRSLLSRVGRVGRVWLRPVDGSSRDANATGVGGGVRKRRRHTAFRDGWVEFLRQADARRAVSLLNRQPMCGAKKRGKWSNDLWAMKYLRGFTWDDLSREVFGSRRERQLKVREQVAAARREKAWVEGRFDLSKRLQKIEKQSVESEQGGDDGGAGDGETTRRVAESGLRIIRRFRQKKALLEDDDDRKARKSAASVDREIESGVGRAIDKDLLGKLFKNPTVKRS